MRASAVFPWPEGKKCAAAVTVDLDAEFYARIFYPGLNVDEGDALRLGRSGMRYGLPRLLDTLRAYGVRATFFVPGEVARRYPQEVRRIADEGHEIACRGMEHEVYAELSPAAQEDSLRRAAAAIEEVCGVRPEGFRMPTGEITEETLRIAASLGFRWSSSLSDRDIPYRRAGSGLIELPIHWVNKDLPYFTFAFDPPIPPGQARSAAMDDVLQNWLYELAGTRHWGSLFVLQLDPQTIGEQGRIFMLETILEKIREAGDVWLAACGEIAAHTERAGY